MGVAQQVGVDEGTVIVRVNTQQGERQTAAEELQSGEDVPLAAEGDGAALGPAGGDIDQGEAVEEFTPGGFAAVSDQVDFGEARAVVVSIGEGADGDLVFEQ